MRPAPAADRFALRLGRAAVVAVVVLTIAAPPALACRPAPDSAWFKSPQDNYRTHAVVFVGQLVNAGRRGGKPENGPNNGRFRVIKTLKGSLGSHVDYTSAWHSCGYFDAPGKILLVFAGPLADGRIHMTAITPRIPFADEAAARAFAEKLRGSHTGPR